MNIRNKIQRVVTSIFQHFAASTKCDTKTASVHITPKEFHSSDIPIHYIFLK